MASVSIVVTMDERTRPDVQLHMLVEAGHRAADELTSLATAIGLPRDVSVSLARGPMGPGRPVEVSAGGSSCWFPPTFLQASAGYLAGQAAIPSSPDAALRLWLGEGPDELSTAEAADRLERLLVGLLRTLVGERPESLLRAALPDDWPTRARADVSVRVSPDYLRRLSLRYPGNEGGFHGLREGLLAELGLPLPGLQLVPDPSLPPASYAVAFAGVPGLPCRGIEDDELLVNQTVERLSDEGVMGAVPTLNPVTWLPGSIVPEATREVLESQGLTTWDDLGMLVLVVAGCLRRHAAWLVDDMVTEEILSRVTWAAPTLVAATREHVGVPALAGVLRALLADQVPVRDVPAVLDRLVEHAVLESEDDPVAAVREQLAPWILQSVGRGTGTVVAYLLDPAVHDLLALTDTVGRGVVERTVVDAVTAELTTLPPTVPPPSLLVPDALRTELRFVRDAVPGLAVVGYRDLPPDANVQPVARIGLQDRIAALTQDDLRNPGTD